MKTIKKFLCVMFLGFMTLLCTSCMQETNQEPNVSKIEVTNRPTIQFNIGDSVDNFTVKGGKIKIFYDDDSNELKDINDNWISSLNYETGEAKITYLNHNIQTKVEGINYIDSVDELNAINNAGNELYVIKSGSYTIHSLRFNGPIALIGTGSVHIILTGSESGQTSALFQGNVTLKNITFTSQADPLVNVLKFGKIEVDNDVPLIEKISLQNINTHGGKGINIMAVSNAKLNNVNIDLDEDTKSVALSASAGTHATISHCRISKGAWGSIAIFGVSAESSQDWYKRKSTLSIADSTIKGVVYIEYYLVSNSTITGLEDWDNTVVNEYRIYTQSTLTAQKA